MNRIAIFNIVLTLVVILQSCEPTSCEEINSQSLFVKNEYIKFPVFSLLYDSNKVYRKYILNSKDTLTIKYSKNYANIGFNQNKRSHYTQYGRTLDCNGENYIDQWAYVTKMNDTTVVLEMELYRCYTLPNYPNRCPDGIQLRTINRFIGDTIINGKLFGGVYYFDQPKYNSKAYINIQDGAFYIINNGNNYQKLP